jgi:uncharacterized protein
MTSRIVRNSLAVLALSLITDALTQNVIAQSAIPEPAPIVFFDIAGQDIDGLRNFYNVVFGWNIGEEQNLASPMTVAVSTPLQGVLRREAAGNMPPNEVLLYLGVADITKTLADVVANGGSVVNPRFEVPGVVVLGLFTDPVGNRFGLVEIENGKAKIPAASN